MTEDANAAPRQCLFPAGVRPVQLYHSPAVLDGDIRRCVEMGWEVAELNAAGWSTSDRLHADLSLRLEFPSYYGRNLDALDDAMAGLAEGRYGFSPDASGGALILRRFDAFLATDQTTAGVLLDIMTTAVHRALRFGWPLALLIQSDDPELVLGGRPSAAVEWNQSERHRSDRV